MEELTISEKQVLKLSAAGLRNGQISWYLQLNKQTIKNQLQTVRIKLQVRTTNEACMIVFGHSDRQEARKRRDSAV